MDSHFKISIFSAIAWTFMAPRLFGESIPTQIQARISQNDPSHYSIYAPVIALNLELTLFGPNMSFKGRPFSGTISPQGSIHVISGPGVNAKVSIAEGNYRVEASIDGDGPKEETLHLSFTLYSHPQSKKADHLPFFTVWGPGSQIHIQPLSRGREYEIVGRVDAKQFTPKAVEILGLVTALAMKDLPAAIK